MNLLSIAKISRWAQNQVWVFGLVVALAFALGIVIGTYHPFVVAEANSWISLTARDAIAAVSVLLTLIVFTHTMHRSRQVHQTDLIFKFSERFESNEMRKKRALAAKALILQQSDDSFVENHQAVDFVLNFFEEVAFLEKRKIVDIESIWHAFSYWTDHFLPATEKYRKNSFGDECTHWQDLEYLCKRVSQFKKLVNENTEVGAKDIREFLEEEANLCKDEEE